jgi:hypothetical protein
MNGGTDYGLFPGKLTKNPVRTLGPDRHADGGGPCPVVDPSGARRRIVRVWVKGQGNRAGKPLPRDFGLRGVNVMTLNTLRERALEHHGKARTKLLTAA